MMSQRSTIAPDVERSAGNAVSDAAILDAAYQLLLAVGVRRMTMADIARRAGVSRATLYRRWQNVTEVVADLMTREWAAVTDHAHVAPTPGGARRQLVDQVVAIAATIRRHPLLRKIIDLDPEVLLPYLLHRRGTTTNHQLALVETGLRAGLADGSVRPGPVQPRARSVLLTAWSFVLTGPVLTDDTDSLDAELHDLLDRYLAP